MSGVAVLVVEPKANLTKKASTEETATASKRRRVETLACWAKENKGAIGKINALNRGLDLIKTQALIKDKFSPICSMHELVSIVNDLPVDAFCEENQPNLEIIVGMIPREQPALKSQARNYLSKLFIQNVSLTLSVASHDIDSMNNFFDITNTVDGLKNEALKDRLIKIIIAKLQLHVKKLLTKYEHISLDQHKAYLDLAKMLGTSLNEIGLSADAASTMITADQLFNDFTRIYLKTVDGIPKLDGSALKDVVTKTNFTPEFVSLLLSLTDQRLLTEAVRIALTDVVSSLYSDDESNYKKILELFSVIFDSAFDQHLEEITNKFNKAFLSPAPTDTDITSLEKASQSILKTVKAIKKIDNWNLKARRNQQLGKFFEKNIIARFKEDSKFELSEDLMTSLFMIYELITEHPYEIDSQYADNRKRFIKLKKAYDEQKKNKTTLEQTEPTKNSPAPDRLSMQAVEPAELSTTPSPSLSLPDPFSKKSLSGTELYYEDCDINTILETKTGADDGKIVLKIDDDGKRTTTSYILNETSDITDESVGNIKQYKAIIPAIDSELIRTVSHTPITFYFDKRTQPAPTSSPEDLAKEWRDFKPGKRLRDDRTDIFDDIKNAGLFELENFNLNSYTPFSISQGHWVAIDIDIQKRAKKITVEIGIYDTFGTATLSNANNAAIVECTRRRIKDEYPDVEDEDITFGNISTYRPTNQTDLTSCGAYCSEFILMLLENRNPHDMGAVEGNSLRLKHFNMVTQSEKHTAITKHVFSTRNRPRLASLGVRELPDDKEVEQTIKRTSPPRLKPAKPASTKNEIKESEGASLASQPFRANLGEIMELMKEPPAL